MRGTKSAVDYDNFSYNGEFMENWCIIEYSWFGSVQKAYEIGKLAHHAVLMVKTPHSRSPITFFGVNMKYYPGGTFIALGWSTEKEGDYLVNIRNKNNNKTV